MESPKTTAKMKPRRKLMRGAPSIEKTNDNTPRFNLRLAISNSSGLLFAVLISNSQPRGRLFGLGSLLQRYKNLDYTTALSQRFQGFTHDCAQHLAAVRSFHCMAGS